MADLHACDEADGTCFRADTLMSHLTNPDWVQVTVNQDSLIYAGKMILDYMMPREMTYVIYLVLIIMPPLISTYLHMLCFALTIVAVVVVGMLFLRYVYIRFSACWQDWARGTCIILRYECARECPVLFAWHESSHTYRHDATSASVLGTGQHQLASAAFLPSSTSRTLASISL